MPITVAVKYLVWSIYYAKILKDLSVMVLKKKA